VVLDPGLWSLLDSGTRRVTVLGPPGSGKSTLLQQTAQRLAPRTRLPRWRAVPLLLDLPAQAERILRGAPLGTIVEAAAGAAPAGLAAALRENRCVLLLDGLDRIVSPDDRAAVVRWIASQESPFVVTAGRRVDTVPGSTAITMRSPTEEQARELLAGASVPNAFRADPLLLTMAASVHKGRGTVPGSRTGLYSVALPNDDGVDALAFDLMTQRVHDPVAFEQRSFQEFHAARHIHRSGREAELVEGLGDGWWREVTLWWATMATVDPVVEAALDSADPAVVSLAVRCAESAAGVSDALVERMQSLIVAGHRDPARRRLVARVEADRQLRPFVVTPDGTRMCRHPVSTNLYRLFREDVGVPEPDGPSEPVPVPPVREPLDLPAVRGAWDADRFVRWVNELTDAGPFRLAEPAAPSRRTVTTDDIVDAVTADAEPMLGHLLSLGIRARSVVIEQVLDQARHRADLVVTGFHKRFRARLMARLAVAENRFGDLQRLSPKELGLGIMQVNAERRELTVTIADLRELIGRIDDPHRVVESARRDEPNWEWAERVAAATDRCLTHAKEMFPDLGTGTAASDIETALRIERQLHDLNRVCLDLYHGLDPDALVGAGTHHQVQSTRQMLRQALDETRRISTVLDMITSTPLPTTAAEPLTRSITWQFVPDRVDPAQSAALALRGSLGPAFATGMAHLVASLPLGPEVRCRRFATGLVRGAGFAPGGTVDVRLDECAAAVADLFAHPTRNRLRQRFLNAAGPVFYRTARADATSLATIRLYALILAGGRSAEAMRHIAAATVTLGRSPDEALVLAHE
jgi:hypothetical protein